MSVRKLMAALFALALLVAACGDSDGDESAEAGATTTAAPDTTDTGSTDTDAPAETTVPAETTEPSEGGDADASAVMRFQWGTPGGSNYDPHVAFNQFANIYLYPAYDRLIELTPEGELVPMLAESWEFLEGDTVLRLNLRDGVTFHDGTPFDADAVVANVERGQSLEASAVKADLASVESVTAVDPSTVDLALSGPGAALPALLADRAGMMVSPTAFENPDLDLRPVGAGPFQVVDHQPGSVITFEQFADYWNPEAQTLAGLELTMQLDPEARLRAIGDGQIDGTTLNPDQVGSAESAGVVVDVEPTLGTFLLFVNMSKPGLEDPMVREAVSMAVDRAGIAEALHEGRCEPTGQVFPSNYWASSPDVEPDPYDVEAARGLMEQAGFGDGLSLTSVVVNVPFYVAQLEAIQAMLGEIGIDLEVTALEPTELLARFASGDSDMYFTQYPGSVDPAKTVASIFAAQASLNPGGYTNADVERLAAEGLSVTDQDARAPIYQQLAAAAAEDNFHIPVCSAQGIRAVSPDVQNLVPTLGGSFDFRYVTLSQ